MIPKFPPPPPPPATTRRFTPVEMDDAAPPPPVPLEVPPPPMLTVKLVIVEGVRRRAAVMLPPAPPALIDEAPPPPPVRLSETMHPLVIDTGHMYVVAPASVSALPDRGVGPNAETFTAITAPDEPGDPGPAVLGGVPALDVM